MATLTPEAAMRVTLLADATFAAITTSVFPWGNVPSNASLPYTTFFRVSTTRNPHLRAASGIVQVRIQWEHYSQSWAVIHNMAQAMRSAFDGMLNTTVTSGADSLKVLAVRLEDENDNALAPGGGEELRILSMQQDWMVHYPESVPTFS